MFLTATVVLFVATAAFGLLLHRQIRQMTLRQIRSNAMDIARIAADQVDAEVFGRLVPGDEDTQEYASVLRVLTRILESSEVEYLYTIAQNDAGDLVFIVDSDPEDPGLIGEAYTGSPDAMRAIEGTAVADDEPYRDRWGIHISAYAPVLHEGRVVGAAVVDLPYDWVQRELRRVTVMVASLASAFFVLSFLLLLFVTRQTERNALRLREAKEKAERSDRAKSEFFARMSHEIRTPINAMLGMNEMILRESRTAHATDGVLANIADSARHAQHAGRELRALMDDMLDFAKIEAGVDAKETDTGDSGGEDPAARAAYTAPRARILAVDDTEINLDVAEGLLAETGITVERALSGAQALLLTLEKKYDVILMDQRMPYMNGTETMQTIREQKGGKNNETPVICVTGDVLAGARERYLAEGFDDYMAKPLDGIRLRALVRGFLPKELVQDAGAGDARDIAQTAGAGHPADVPVTVNPKILRRFYDTIEDNAAEIERFYEEEDYENYTIKVHALKSSALLIGEEALSKDAAYLEACGYAACGEKWE
ncbi:MAG: response regulator [Lachnospiraceae bacterium]|nr:response regulator [Lachnospiraceae bacterium]